MSVSTSPGGTFRAPNPRDLLRRAWSFSRPLTFVSLAMLATLAATTVGILLDPRVITGAPAWLKPAKFAVSISIYCFTLLWLLTFVKGRPRLVGIVAWTTAIALFVEEVIIVGQVMRGTTSHFNVATTFDATLFRAMAVFVVMVWVANLLTIVLLLLQRLPDRAFAWSLRLGLIVSFVGMGVAFLMTATTPEQLAATEAGERLLVSGAHAVGVADGGPGLPIVGWSTTGGDLRVAHFVGLHALQVLPLFGWLLSAFGARWLGPRSRLGLVLVSGLAYLGVVLLLTWQALRGQPLISPDATTLTAFLSLFVVAGIAAAALVVFGGRRAPPAGAGG